MSSDSFFDVSDSSKGINYGDFLGARINFMYVFFFRECMLFREIVKLYVWVCSDWEWN